MKTGCRRLYWSQRSFWDSRMSRLQRRWSTSVSAVYLHYTYQLVSKSNRMKGASWTKPHLRLLEWLLIFPLVLRICLFICWLLLPPYWPLCHVKFYSWLGILISVLYSINATCKHHMVIPIRVIYCVHTYRLCKVPIPLLQEIKMRIKPNDSMKIFKTFYQIYKAFSKVENCTYNTFYEECTLILSLTPPAFICIFLGKMIDNNQTLKILCYPKINTWS